MARDLNEAWGWIQRLVARVSRLESGAMLENSSITNGRMRFIGGLLRVDSGGRVEIVGTLDADGTINFTGPFTAKGTTRLDGYTTQVGPLGLEGVFTIKAGGKIVLQGTYPIEIGQSGGLASIDLGGAKLYGAPSGGIFGTGSSLLMMSASEAQLINSASGVKGVTVTSAGTTIDGTFWSNLQPKAGAVANVHVDSNGKFWRTS